MEGEKQRSGFSISSRRSLVHIVCVPNVGSAGMCGGTFSVVHLLEQGPFLDVNLKLFLVVYRY